MTTFTTILVPLDGSALGSRALPYAAFLARVGGSRLVLLHVAPERELPHRAGPERAAAPFHDELAAQYRMDGIDATAETVVGDPGAAIWHAASDLRAGLIVMSTHGRGGLGRLILGSVAQEVVEHAATPVVLVTARCDRRWASERAFRILVPLDGSALAEAAVPLALALGRQLGADLRLLRVVPEHLELNPLGFGYTDPASPRELDDARAYLERVAASLRPAAHAVTSRVLAGHPAGAIARLADDEGMDLIVMATHGHDTLGRVLLEHVATATTGGRIHFDLGSTATAILQQGATPVLLTRCTERSCVDRARERDGNVTVTDPGA